MFVLSMVGITCPRGAGGEGGGGIVCAFIVVFQLHEDISLIGVMLCCIKLV